MARPATRQQLIDYALRSLGEPVIQVNVDEDQIEDRLDEALQYYQEFHSDGVVRIYRKHQITEEDVENKYLTLPESILFVTRIFPVYQSGTSTGIFSVEYQLRLNDIYDLRMAGSMINYTMVRQYMALLDLQLNGLQQITTFSRHQNRLYIELDWVRKLQVGEYVIVEGYEIVDPEIYANVWNDMILKRYFTALLKKQWGANLSKFEGVQLPGGITFNGRQIYDDALQEIQKIEEEMDIKYQQPVDFFVG